MNSGRYPYNYSAEENKRRDKNYNTRLQGATLLRERAEYDRPNYDSGYRQRAYRNIDENNDHKRGLLDRASDQLASWLGDDEAERRRRIDARYEARRKNAEQRSEYYRNYEGNLRNRSWDDIRARDLMTRNVVCVHPDDTAEQAARLMRDCDCGALPVIDYQGRMVGMVTDRDMAVRLIARGGDGRTPVSYCMTNEVFACDEQSTIEECMREMSRHQIRRIPIVDNQERIVGIVSQGDLAQHAGEYNFTGEQRAIANTLCAISEPTSDSYA